jgi:hypothetical protein
LLGDSEEEEVYQIIEQYKRKNKTIDQYIKSSWWNYNWSSSIIVKILNEYFEPTVTHFIFQFIEDEKTLNLFHSKVIKMI